MNQFVIANLIIIICTITISCGYQQTLRAHCHIGDTQTCDNLFGVNQEEVDEQQSTQFTAQQKELESLTTLLSELAKDVRSIESQAQTQQQMLDMLEVMAMQQSTNTTAINQMLVDINQDLVDTQEKIAYEQARINSLAIDVANLNAQDTVIESVYPCGDRANMFDEAFLRMKSGKLIAYFESGGQRFLTILSPGEYRTTDSNPYCYFGVNSQHQIVNARR